jgi:hypothetical protein
MSGRGETDKTRRRAAKGKSGEKHVHCTGLVVLGAVGVLEMHEGSGDVLESGLVRAQLLEEASDPQLQP